MSCQAIKIQLFWKTFIKKISYQIVIRVLCRVLSEHASTTKYFLGYFHSVHQEIF